MESPQKLRITHELKPVYYDKFRCLMGDCALSCCKDNWKIAFSKKDYLRLRHLKCSPGLEENLSKTVRRIRHGPAAERWYAEFDMSAGVCPMLTEEGLCGLQMEQGGEVLPRVCKVFPRMEACTGAGLERSLSPGCEGVLGLLWELPEGIDFVLEPLPKPLQAKRLYDTPLFLAHEEVRSLCIDFLQDRTLPLPRRILLMCMLLRDLADHPEDPERWLRKAAGVLAEPGREELCAGLSGGGAAGRNLRIINNLNLLQAIRQNDEETNRLRRRIQETLEAYWRNGQTHFCLEDYLRCEAVFRERYGEREWFFENLMVCIYFHMSFPVLTSPEELWKSCVNFCNLYSICRFISVLSCYDRGMDEAAARAELFRGLTLVSRGLLHNPEAQTHLRDELFQNDSATLAHMAILLDC